MRTAFISALLLSGLSICSAQAARSPARLEAEYYVSAYADHYRVPIALIRAIIQRESDWQPCTVSRKGAVGLMQLMPMTAKRLGVGDRCSLDQNISGGVRYLAWLMRLFRNDLRLTAAAYYAGEDVIGRRGLDYCNPDVVAYVKAIRSTYLREMANELESKNNKEKRDVR
jgi:soluble lytic murein transglycosylase-like protein